MYCCVQEELTQVGTGLLHLDQILRQPDILEYAQKLNVLIILPSAQHVDEIVEGMKHRNNGLDLLSADYVCAQTAVFAAAATITKWTCLVIPPSVQLYSPLHFHYISTAVHQKLAPLLDLKISLQTTGELFQAHSTDAGYDLTIKDEVHCPAGKMVKILLAEQVCIPPGHYGLLAARSSTNLLGSLRCGIVDAGYTGPLSAIFVSDEDLLLPAGRRFAQLVVQPLSCLSVKKVDIFDNTNRGCNGFGSSGTQ